MTQSSRGMSQKSQKLGGRAPNGYSKWKIIEDLEKSGFGSELAALRLFDSAQFRTVAGKVYFDELLNCQREVDVLAENHVTTQVDNWTCETTMWVAGEVKKNERPWIVLKSGTHENLREIHSRETILEIQNVRSGASLRQNVTTDSLFTRKVWLGHGVREALKKPGDLSRWYKAASSVTRACYTAMGERATNQANVARMTLRQPLVILDGQLFSAAIDENFRVQLTEITRATVLFQETNASFKKTFLVDLVVLKSLAEYLPELNDWLLNAHRKLTGYSDTFG